MVTVEPADVVRAIEKTLEPGSNAGNSPTVCAGSFDDGMSSLGLAVSAHDSTAASARNCGSVTFPAIVALLKSSQAVAEECGSSHHT